MNIGVIGCGNISGIYLENLHQRFDAVDILAVADVEQSRAAEKAEEYGIPSALPVDALIEHPDIEMVLVLTNPDSHSAICRRVVEHGKHAYTEKPLGVDFDQGRELIELAGKNGVRVGAAPDTFLGGGIQTVRKLVDDGEIGEPVAAVGFMMSSGPESWHPNPFPFYQRGAGPLFDMGPYYITSLVSLFGPVKRVAAASRISRPERPVTRDGAEPAIIKVNTPTHVAGSLEFVSGPIATLVLSFDVAAHRLPCIELYGTTGSIAVPDPNRFGGPVSIYRERNAGWRDEPLQFGYTTNSRGIGVVDMAKAIAGGRPHRASGKLSLHVLEVMHGLLTSGSSGLFYEMTTTCDRPTAMPQSAGDVELD
jgi:predicted dehydrogenase